MKKLLSILLVPFIFLTGCGTDKGGDDSMPNLRDTTSLEKYLSEHDNAVLVDVRSPGEFESGHIPGATLLPVETVAADAEKILPDKETPVIVYCRSGNRSAKAAKTLRKAGYSTVYDFGAIRHWTGDLEKGLPGKGAA